MAAVTLASDPRPVITEKAARAIAVIEAALARRFIQEKDSKPAHCAWCANRMVDYRGAAYMVMKCARCGRWNLIDDR